MITCRLRYFFKQLLYFTGTYLFFSFILLSPGYSVVDPARKLVSKKDTYLKKFDFISVRYMVCFFVNLILHLWVFLNWSDKFDIIWHEMIQFDPKLPRHDWVQNMKYIDRTESKSEMIFTLDCVAVYSCL